MRAAASFLEFVTDPVGGCFASRSWLYVYPHERFCGVVLWGHPDLRDIEQLVRLFAVELGRARHVAIVDAHRVQSFDPRAFLLFQRYIRDHYAVLAACLERLALVRPNGMLGAAAAGFFAVTPQPYPSRVFESRASALAWLGSDAVQSSDAIANEETRAAGAPPLLRDLRLLLDAGHVATLDEGARRLGASGRTLQRKLAELETSFAGEVAAARVRRAKRLLRESDASLTTIAFEVGCASLSSFSALFRRAAGAPPSVWRERHRRKSA